MASAPGDATLVNRIESNLLSAESSSSSDHCLLLLRLHTGVYSRPIDHAYYADRWPKTYLAMPSSQAAIKDTTSVIAIFVASYYWIAYMLQIKLASSLETKRTRKGGNYSDVLPLKVARRDGISNLTSDGASNLSIWAAQTQCRFI